jgi:hypothetical protein
VVKARQRQAWSCATASAETTELVAQCRRACQARIYRVNTGDRFRAIDRSALSWHFVGPGSPGTQLLVSLKIIGRCEASFPRIGTTVARRNISATRERFAADLNGSGASG